MCQKYTCKSAYYFFVKITLVITIWFFQKPKIALNSLNKSRRAVLTPFLDIRFIGLSVSNIGFFGFWKQNPIWDQKSDIMLRFRCPYLEKKIEEIRGNMQKWPNFGGRWLFENFGPNWAILDQKCPTLTKKWLKNDQNLILCEDWRRFLKKTRIVYPIFVKMTKMVRLIVVTWDKKSKNMSYFEKKSSIIIANE